MKKTIEEIKKFVNDRFNPQGIKIDVDFTSDANKSGNNEMIIQLTPGENMREDFNWGRTLTLLRENFLAPIHFWTVNELVNDDNFETEIICFRLK